MHSLKSHIINRPLVKSTRKEAYLLGLRMRVMVTSHLDLKVGASGINFIIDLVEMEIEKFYRLMNEI